MVLINTHNFTAVHQSEPVSITVEEYTTVMRFRFKYDSAVLSFITFQLPRDPRNIVYPDTLRDFCFRVLSDTIISHTES